MKTCRSMQMQFSGYLDGAVRGTQMQAIAAHLEQCAACAKEFDAWRDMQRLLSAAGPAKAPAGMELRLRVALSRERSGSRARRRLDRWQMRWENAIAPFLVRASAGFASSVIFLGTVILLVGTFAAPEPLVANDATVDSVSAPKFLYSLAGADLRLDTPEPIVVEASVSNDGRVYDYRIISGSAAPEVQAELTNLLLLSVFSPARFYGQPVASHAVLSFTRIAVHG